MQDYIEQRVLEISNYILETGATVRQVAKVFGFQNQLCIRM